MHMVQALCGFPVILLERLRLARVIGGNTGFRKIALLNRPFILRFLGFQGVADRFFHDVLQGFIRARKAVKQNVHGLAERLTGF